jgi:hypothetical protein
LQLAIEIENCLRRFGFHRIQVELPADFVAGVDFRLFEDEVCFVAVCTFLDWPALSVAWHDAQEVLGTLIGGRVAAFDPKTWDGYLVLGVGQTLTPNDRAEAVSIRYDTRRARKIVISGDEVLSVSALELALMPVRPMLVATATPDARDPLAELLEHMRRTSTEPDGIEQLLDSYRRGRLLIEDLHQSRSAG